MSVPPILACPECDLLHQAPPEDRREEFRCTRCGAILQERHSGSLDMPLAFAIAALIFFGLANLFPILSMRMSGQLEEATLPGCVRLMAAQGWPWLSAIVLTTVEVAPLAYLGGLVHVLIRARTGKVGRTSARMFRLTQELPGWAMAEVFLLGVLVAYVKLTKNAAVTPGPSLYALGAFVVTIAAAEASLNPHAVWAAIRERR